MSESDAQSVESTIKVDPQRGEVALPGYGDANQRVYISVYAVHGLSSMCMEAVCYPTVSIFLSNEDYARGRDLRIKCEAFGPRGDLVANAFVDPKLAVREHTITSAVFDGADYRKFARVNCKIVSAIPNDLRD